MGGFSDFPVFGQLASGVMGGIGEQKRNKDLRDLDATTGYRVENLREMADPIRDALVAGLQPGGYLRRAMAVPGIMEAEQKGADLQEQAARGAYLYGGKNYGRSGSYLQRARTAVPVAAVAAQYGAEVNADETLSRIDAAVRGSEKAFPDTLPVNPYASYAAGLNSFSESYSDSFKW